MRCRSTIFNFSGAILRGWIEALNIFPPDRVFEIGTGSGYATAVLSRIAAEGNRLNQSLLRITRTLEGKLVEENLAIVRFVPLVGEEGW
ncbi:MAG: hypothetical protein GX825_06195 [Syntrophomonadaceae bacterium]|nr:hypothetical protein [Syntrophomonadaceae bacterium]